MKRYLLVAPLLIASSIPTTFANDRVKNIDIGLAGNGCPEEVRFNIPALQNFELSSDATKWSKCGADTILPWQTVHI